jgi:thymidylate synthase (FAD)
MILVKPSAKIFYMSGDDGRDSLKAIEYIGRVCYKTEHAITGESHSKFVDGLIKRGHESVIEHISVTAHIICDRGVSHEIVRHRIASYSQESTRYCNYNNGVTFVIPPWVNIATGEYNYTRCVDSGCNDQTSGLWAIACKFSEDNYLRLLSLGWTPQQARTVLNNSTKTELYMTANMREWRHFFKLRTAPAAHPQMREIAIPLLEEFKREIPVVFDDINGGENAKMQSHDTHKKRWNCST